MQKIDYIPSQTPLWYGKPKYHYKIYKNNKLYYSCVSTMQNQSEVLESILRRFKGDSKPYKVFCNGKLIEIVNSRKTGRKKKYQWSSPS